MSGIQSRKPEPAYFFPPLQSPPRAQARAGVAPKSTRQALRSAPAVSRLPTVQHAAPPMWHVRRVSFAGPCTCFGMPLVVSDRSSYEHTHGKEGTVTHVIFILGKAVRQIYQYIIYRRNMRLFSHQSCHRESLSFNQRSCVVCLIALRSRHLRPYGPVLWYSGRFPASAFGR